jgi:hypothetical protein
MEDLVYPYLGISMATIGIEHKYCLASNGVVLAEDKTAAVFSYLHCVSLYLFSGHFCQVATSMLIDQVLIRQNTLSSTTRHPQAPQMTERNQTLLWAALRIRKPPPRRH